MVDISFQESYSSELLSLAVFPTTYTPLVKISAVTAKNIEVLAYFLVYKFCEKQSFRKVSGESL